MLKVTQKAAEEIRRRLSKLDAEDAVFRVSAFGGNCCGNRYNYGFDIATGRDAILELEGVTVAIDRFSLPLLESVELDFTRDQYGGVFVFNEPVACRTRG